MKSLRRVDLNGDVVILRVMDSDLFRDMVFIRERSKENVIFWRELPGGYRELLEMDRK